MVYRRGIDQDKGVRRYADSDNPDRGIGDIGCILDLCLYRDGKGETEMSKYIDIDDISLRKTISVGGLSAKALWRRIQQEPSIDIVRCQDCKHWVYNFNGCARNPCTEPWYATDFCNYGEREGE